jgi:hypothetical protein
MRQVFRVSGVLDVDSGEIIAQTLTSRETGDISQVDPLLDRIDGPTRTAAAYQSGCKHYGYTNSINGYLRNRTASATLPFYCETPPKLSSKLHVPVFIGTEQGE